MRRLVFAIVMTFAFGLLPRSSSSVAAKAEPVPRLPGAVLLLGYPDSELALTIGNKTSKLQSGGEWYVRPSMSANGRVIASAHTVPGDSPASRPRLIVSTYSMADTTWTDFKGLEVFDGDVAISPDGLKLACITRRGAGAPSHIRILDLRTGKINVVPESTTNAGPTLTWSPDGKHIAFDRADERSENQLRTIYLLNVESGTVSKIADGASPSWSPSGEWLAFFDYSPNRDDPNGRWHAANANRVSLIHPDGTYQKVLVTFRAEEDLRLSPVWSPDSAAILINRIRDDNLYFKVDIEMLDIATLKLAKKFKNVPPVYGWAEEK